MNNIIDKLRYFDKKFPRKELEGAIERKDEIIPLLLDSLDEINDDIKIVTENPDYMLHMYAIHLLAQFREKRAFKKLIDLISYSPEEVDEVLGDTLTEGLASILYSTYDGDSLLLQGVIENPLLNQYARSAALDVYAKLYFDELISRDHLIDYLKGLVSEIMRIEDFELATFIEGVVIDYHLFEMMEDVQLLYDEDYIDEYMYGKYDDFIDFLFRYDNVRDKVSYIDSAIEAMEWWACFEKSEEEKRERKARLNALEKHIKKNKNTKKNKNITKTKEKIGRNDPCPCGSGKKYKKCCIDKVIDNEEEDFFEMEDRDKWLDYYPTDEIIQEGQVLITDMFDQESINIDKLVYLALHHRSIPMWEKRDKLNEDKNKILYLTEACNLFLEKCEKEGINSFNEYDKKYKIHYRSKIWFQKFESILEEYNKDHIYDIMLDKVRGTVKKHTP